jgi:adenylate cyclase
MRVVGKGRWPANPTICTACLKGLEKMAGGAEIELSLLFADIRGSTSLAESMSPSAYRALLDRFYAAASGAVEEHGGIVDKFLGDGVMALFLPALAADASHAGGAIESGRAVARRSNAIAVAPGSTLPVGVGVHTGVAFVGSVEVSPGTFDFTALGDSVNIAARLGSVAEASEVLVSETSAEAANLDTSPFSNRELELRGKSQKLTAWVLT